MSATLRGRCIVVTRAEHQAAPLVAAIEREGGVAVRFPTIDIVAPSDGGAALRAAVANLESYDWLIFTSANTVEWVEPLLESFLSCKLAAIGRSTLTTLEDLGISVDLVAPEPVAESLLAALLERSPETSRFLLPRAAVAREILPDGLRAAGHHVDVVEAYQTIAATPDPERREAVMQADVYTFTSSSTVEQFVRLVPEVDRAKPAVCLGPITAETARSTGFSNVHVADGASVEALIAALARAVGSS